MNELRRPASAADEISRISELVGTHALPEFVLGFDVDVGDFDGDPATWITFHLSGSDLLPLEELERRSELLVSLQHERTPQILDLPGERFPFFRSDHGGDTTRT